MMRSALVGLLSGACLLMAPEATGVVIVDDFNVASPASAVDTTVGGAGTGVAITGSASTEGTVMDGDTAWRRALYAELTVGDRVAAQDCAVCQQAHVTANANSSGQYYLRWSGPPKDLSGHTRLQFDWTSDAPGNGTQAWVEVADGTETVLSAPIVLTPGPLLANIALPAFNGTGAGYGGIVAITLRFAGTLAVDGDIDNVTLTGPRIDLEKLVSVDNQATFVDADAPTGPSTIPGASVFFRLVVTNDGDEPLTNVTLSDTDFDTTACGIPGTLAPGASFTCVLGPHAAVSGQHSNTAIVNAQGQTSGAAVSDADPAHYVAPMGPPLTIPTMSQWGIVLLSGLLGLLAFTTVRQRRQ